MQLGPFCAAFMHKSINFHIIWILVGILCSSSSLKEKGVISSASDIFSRWALALVLPSIALMYAEGLVWFHQPSFLPALQAYFGVQTFIKLVLQPQVLSWGFYSLPMFALTLFVQLSQKLSFAPLQKRLLFLYLSLALLQNAVSASTMLKNANVILPVILF